MNLSTHPLRLAVCLTLALALAACTSDSTGPEASDDAVYLRVTNDRAVAVSVRVVGADAIAAADRITVDFGSVAAGTTTSFREVNESFSVFVDGTIYQNGGNDLWGIDNTPTSEWTLTLQASGGWELKAYFGS